MEFSRYSIWKVHEMNYLGDSQLVYSTEHLLCDKTPLSLEKDLVWSAPVKVYFIISILTTGEGVVVCIIFYSEI
jgi:hypothetical protein